MRFERSPQYRRAWAILLGCVAVVASCSKKPEESAATIEPQEKAVPSAIAAPAPDQGAWDPDSEWSAIESLPKAQRGRDALDLYRRWGKREGEAAVLHAETHGTAIASASLKAAFGGWLSADPDGAKAWVMEVPGGRRLLKLAGALGEALDSPAARAQWANEQAHEKTGGHLLSRAIVEWARSDSAPDAIAWLDGNGGLDDRPAELGTLMRAWSDHDASAASESLSAMPPGVGRDAAVAALVTVIAPEQLEAARAWAETVEDEQKRSDLLDLVAKIGGGGGLIP